MGYCLGRGGIKITLYVVECETPNTFYVGTTYRHPSKRYREHFEGWGCKWTRRHGCKRILASWEVNPATASRDENDVWMHYARIYGAERVRGGDVTYVGPHDDDSLPDWILPEEFGGQRMVDWGM